MKPRLNARRLDYRVILKRARVFESAIGREKEKNPGRTG